MDDPRLQLLLLALSVVVVSGKSKGKEETSIYLDCLKPGPGQVQPKCDPHNSRCCVGLECFVQKKGDVPRCGNPFEGPVFKQWGADAQPQLSFLISKETVASPALSVAVLLAVAVLCFALVKSIRRRLPRRPDVSSAAYTPL